RGQRAGLMLALTPNVDVGTIAFMGQRPEANGPDRSVEPPRQSGGAITLRRWLGRTTHLDVEAGRMFETGSTLGLTGTGVFSSIDGATTNYLKLAGGMAMGPLSLDAA